MADPTLENVALEVGFTTEPETIFDPSGKESFVGLACFLSRSPANRWKDLIQPKDKWLAWFGYIHRH